MAGVDLAPFCSSVHELDVISQVAIDLGERSYDILIGSDLLKKPSCWQGLPSSHLALIVTNTTVKPLYAQALMAQLQNHHKEVQVCTLPDGEEHKTWATLESIFDALVDQAADRKTVIYALGGGVVGDMTGFAAACYMRGVPFVQVPTTLLAQVDSSVGGKTAVNHPRAKNMLGAFYQPHRVICDVATLSTLSDREFSAGMSEIIKYGPIADPLFFDWLELHIDALMQRDRPLLQIAIERSCQIKAWVVAGDERESGLREILNLGHTFGHAIESSMGYGHWLHGEAVAAGMVMAIDLSIRTLGLDPHYGERLRALLKKAQLPVKGPILHQDPEQHVQQYMQKMKLDKKASAGDIRFVLIAQWGKALPQQKVPQADVKQTLLDCCAL